MDNMYYRGLLKRYMMDVSDAEGVFFTDWLSGINTTDEDQLELEKLIEEIKGDNNE